MTERMRDKKGKGALRASVFIVVALVLISGIAPAQAISWGDPDTTHTNVGALMVLDTDYGGWYPLCSGTLIYPDVFLTAGHCTEVLQYYSSTGRFSDYGVCFDYDPSLTDPGNYLGVDEIYTHPDYNPFVASNSYDVGILILENPVTGITPATLPSEGYLDDLWEGRDLRPRGRGAVGAAFTVVGYGGTLYWPPPYLVYEDKRQFAYSQFQALLDVWLVLSQNNARGNGGSCYGDSGGPIFWDDNGAEVLVAVVSWGDPECVSTGFNYRVDIPETLDFIEDVTLITSPPQP